MRVLIYGAGALGSIIGGLLSEEHDVTLVCRDRHARAISERGLRLEGILDRAVHPKVATSIARLERPDLVLVTVKAYDTERAISDIGGWISLGTDVVFFQNGLTILEQVDKLTSGFIGVATLGAMCTGPGKVSLTGRGDLTVGKKGGGHVPTALMETLEDSGFPCRITDDIIGEVWMKALVNSCINPITAITGRTNDVIIADRDINALVRVCFRESLAVSRGSGVDIPDRIDFDIVERVATETSANRSSMLQDVDRGGRTEIEHINGEIVRKADALGIEVPINRCLRCLVNALGPLRHQLISEKST